MKKSMVALASPVAALALPAMASASTSLDPSSGTGFVGKGDVQQVFGLTNAQIQPDANSVGFTYNSADTKVDETTWTCTNKASNNQYKSDTTTTATTTMGVSDSVARVKNQVTGFTLNGFTSTPTTTGGTPPPGSTPSSAASTTTRRTEASTDPQPAERAALAPLSERSDGSASALPFCALAHRRPTRSPIVLGHRAGRGRSATNFSRPLRLARQWSHRELDISSRR